TSRPATAKRTRAPTAHTVDPLAGGEPAETPVTTLASASIGRSARCDREGKALPAIAPPEHLPARASRRAARDIASGRRAAHAASGSGGSIRWIRSHSSHRERDARRIRRRVLALEDRLQSFPPRIWESLPEPHSLPARNLRRE